MTNDITAHMIVRNEEQWVWYAIQSVIDYVDHFLIYDTGSEDKTVAIIKTTNSEKIKFSQKGKVTPDQLVNLRNEQIKSTITSWFLLLDGDEVWPRSTIEELSQAVKKAAKNITAIVVPAHVPVGDLYHYQSDSAGRYHVLGQIGHFNIRAYQIKSGYKWKGTYPLEAYVDKNHFPVQEKESELKLLKNKYWHLTHMPRSSQDNHGKRKYEIGTLYKEKIPQVFNLVRPELVPSPWIKYQPWENLRAWISTPLIKIKRRISPYLNIN